MGRDPIAAMPPRIGSNDFARFRSRWRAFRRRRGGPLLSLLELFFLLALLFQLFLPLLVPEVGFCQVVFSSSYGLRSETHRSSTRNYDNATAGSIRVW